jgi:hypothetical protein
MAWEIRFRQNDSKLKFHAIPLVFCSDIPSFTSSLDGRINNDCSDFKLQTKYYYHVQKSRPLPPFHTVTFSPLRSSLMLSSQLLPG